MKAGIFARTSGGEIRAIGPGRLERESIWREPENPAEELWYRGLIFRAFADLGDGPLEYIYIPEDLAVPAEAARPQAQPAAPLIVPVSAPDRARKVQNSLAVDVCSMLALSRELPAQVDRAGHLRDADAERFTAGLLPPGRDATRLEMLLTLARMRGWLKPDRGRLVLDTGSATAWLRLTHWEQMTVLFNPAATVATPGTTCTTCQPSSPRETGATIRAGAPRGDASAAFPGTGGVVSHQRSDRTYQGDQPGFSAAGRRLYPVVFAGLSRREAISPVSSRGMASRGDSSAF